MRKIVGLFAAALAAIASPATASVTLLFNGSGQLTGATGVSVRDARFDGIVSYSTYDVTFEEGTCSALFSGCDQDSDFTMTDGGDSLAAYYGAQALLDQVLIGTYDTSPALTFGCGSPYFCEVLIPYSGGFGFVFTSNAFNSTTDDTVSSGLYSSGFDTTNGPNALENTNVFARFTLSAAAPLPEPSTWAMMLLGFGAVGLMLRRKRQVLASFV